MSFSLIANNGLPSSWAKQRMGLTLLLLSLLLSPRPAFAQMGWETFIPPEFAFRDNIHQKITLPKQLNINESSLTQLQILPGINEEIALKMMRGRPFSDVQDFYSRLPGMTKKQVDVLIEQIQPKILFK